MIYLGHNNWFTTFLAYTFLIGNFRKKEIDNMLMDLIAKQQAKKESPKKTQKQNQKNGKSDDDDSISDDEEDEEKEEESDFEAVSGSYLS